MLAIRPFVTSLFRLHSIRPDDRSVFIRFHEVVNQWFLLLLINEFPIYVYSTICTHPEWHSNFMCVPRIRIWIIYLFIFISIASHRFMSININKNERTWGRLFISLLKGQAMPVRQLSGYPVQFRTTWATRVHSIIRTIDCTFDEQVEGERKPY